MFPQINAITVSVNYAQKLDYIAMHNAQYFKKWIVITEQLDEATRKVCAKYPNIEMMLYNFTSPYTTFDKGGALQKAQVYLYTTCPDDYVLILDSDIALPTNFRELISTTSLEQNALYGTVERRDFTRKSDLDENKNYTIYTHSNNFAGYFSLYKNRGVFYNRSYNCSMCDMDFRDLFTKKIHIPNLTVYHLGKEGVNWDGIKKEDFEWDELT